MSSYIPILFACQHIMISDCDSVNRSGERFAMHRDDMALAAQISKIAIQSETQTNLLIVRWHHPLTSTTR